MTWWRFSRWRPRNRICASDFGFSDSAQLGRSRFTCQPNFSDISQSTVEILLLPVSDNKWPPRWNSTVGFHLLCMRHHRHVILHLSTQFRPSRTILDIVMTSYPSFKMAAESHIEFSQVTADHLRIANGGLSLFLKVRLDRIVSEILLLSCC